MCFHPDFLKKKETRYKTQRPPHHINQPESNKPPGPTRPPGPARHFFVPDPSIKQQRRSSRSKKDPKRIHQRQLTIHNPSHRPLRPHPILVFPLPTAAFCTRLDCPRVFYTWQPSARAHFRIIVSGRILFFLFRTSTFCLLDCCQRVCTSHPCSQSPPHARQSTLCNTNKVTRGRSSRATPSQRDRSHSLHRINTSIPYSFYCSAESSALHRRITSAQQLFLYPAQIEFFAFDHRVTFLPLCADFRKSASPRPSQHCLLFEKGKEEKYTNIQDLLTYIFPHQWI